AAEEETEDRLVPQRGEEEEREHPLGGRPPEQRVVREEALVRVEEIEHRDPADQIDEQDDGHPDAPEADAARVDGQVLLDEPARKAPEALVAAGLRRRGDGSGGRRRRGRFWKLGAHGQWMKTRFCQPVGAVSPGTGLRCWIT